MAGRILRALPIGLAALVWAACAVLLMANMLTKSVGHPPMRLVPGLAGVTWPQKPHWSLHAVLDGSYQGAFARDIGTRMPLYPWAVRLRNQVGWSVFGANPVPSVLIGRDGTMIEVAYAQEYCSRDVAVWRPGGMVWAARIRQMQDAVERRGHAFLYVLTPSKVAQYPDLLPAGYPCPASLADRTGLLPAWRAMLLDAGVHFADTPAALTAAHADYPFPLYPAGGTHWNAVGAAIGQQAVLAGLDALRPGDGFAPYHFTWHMQPRATGNDVDLARLFNLFVPLSDGPVPATVIEPAPPSVPCRPPSVVIVGGSFSQSTVEALGRLPCSVAATDYQYWRAYTLGWDGAKVSIRAGVDGPARDAAVLGADVLIFEENEETLRNPEHGRALWQFLQTALPADAAR